MNQLYDSFKSALLKGEINLETDTLVAYAVDLADYTFSAAHEALTDLTTGGGVVATSPALTGKVVSISGNFDSADPVLPSVTGDTFEAIVLYDQTTDNLVGYWDGISQTPSGNNITINVAAGGWFDL
jgi:hypothetical protein